VTTLVAYESSWKYLQVAWGASSGFEDPEFDDSLWATGATPFGSSYDCNYVYTTAWASGTDMLLRRTITIPANTASLDFVFGIDDIVSTYLDGVLINATDSTGGPCATRTDHTFSIASPTAGTFVLAVRARDTAWQGFFEMEVTTTVGCDSPLAFDVYSLGTATTPALTYLATLCDAFDKSFRVELDGTGSGKFSINRSSADATAAILGDGDGDVRYVKVRIPAIDTDPMFGFFIEEGDFRLLDEDEDGGETLTFSGHGSLAYLDFARMAAHSYITNGMDPFGGLWRLYLAGTGSKPGQMLNRVITEAQDSDRPQKPLPLLTDTFDYTNDSNAAAWASSTATDEFAAQIGESVLSVVGRLIGTVAITVQMSPNLVLSAYNTFGTNRASATFAAGKVRFVGGVNIAEGLTRQVRPSRVATHALVYGEEEKSVIAALADAASRVTREAFLSAAGTGTTALTAVGDADLAERLLRSESISFRIALGADDAAGLYLPGPAGSTAGKFWVGDTVTLHTGSGEFDFANQSIVVAAINIIEGDAVAAVTDLEVRVELGSTTLSPAAGSAGGGSVGLTPASGILSASPGGGSPITPFHTHPTAALVSAWKEPVRAASTGNLSISAPGATIDGVTMAAQDRFLAKDQTAGAENGIYIWLGAAVAAVRAPDFSSGSQAVGAAVFVSEGTVNADRIYACTTNATITLGTTALTFAEVGGGGGSVVPYFLAATDTFTVPIYKQALFEEIIDVEGILTVDGYLIMVS